MTIDEQEKFDYSGISSKEFYENLKEKWFHKGEDLVSPEITYLFSLIDLKQAKIELALQIVERLDYVLSTGTETEEGYVEYKLGQVIKELKEWSGKYE
jgi:hypothetical protein